MPAFRLCCSASISTPSATSSHESVIFEIFLFRIFVHFFRMLLYFRRLTFPVCSIWMRFGKNCYTIESNEWIPSKTFQETHVRQAAESVFGLAEVCICTNFHRFFSVFVLRGCKQQVAQRPYISFFVSCISSATYTIHKSTHRVCSARNRRCLNYVRDKNVQWQLFSLSKMWRFGQIGFTWMNLGLLALSHICICYEFMHNISIELTQTQSPAGAAPLFFIFTPKTERNWIYSPNALPSQQSDDYSSLSS